MSNGVNIYLIIVLSVLLLEYIKSMIVETLNANHVSTQLPPEFKDFYDSQKYSTAQAYLKERTRFFLMEETLGKVLIVAFILIGGFNFVDQFARRLSSHEIVVGLIFAGILMLVSQIISIPFSYYKTFVIEEKYGFNRSTKKTFFTDILKGLAIGAIVGGIVFALVILLFLKVGGLAWIYCWVSVTLFSLFLMFISPVVIMPLFNKFVPVEEGELKDKLGEYAKSQNFKMQGLFTMDGSKRSSKSNAFFTGFGKFRRIALYDTLIQKHTTDEIVTVLAHEIGHYKCRHILKTMMISIFSSGAMFYLLSLFIKNPGLFAAFKMDNLSVYGSLIFFGFLYTPINMVLSIFSSILSRKHEYEADKFAITTYGHAEDFILALKKLTVDNLGNLTPHKIKVFFDYSHPPVLKRIEAIRKVGK